MNVEEETEPDDSVEFNTETEKYAKAVLEEIRKLPGGRFSSFLADNSFPRQVSHQDALIGDPILPKPPLRLIADSIISGIQLKETQKKRYGDLIRYSARIEDGLCDQLTPAAREVFEKGSITLDDLIGIGGNPDSDDRSGVYLHILRIPNMFYLYVGQAVVLSERIQYQHNDPEKRRKYPSLHYKVWEELEGQDDFESIFVTLGTVGHYPRDSSEQLSLNLLEMFGACILQTLKSSDLEFWLPEGFPVRWADRGLNVALPLWQGYISRGSSQILQADMKMTKEEFSAALHGANETRRQWAINVKNSYQSLRVHPDPQMQAIWWKYFEKCCAARDQLFLGRTKSYYTTQNNSRKNALDFLANGKQCKIVQSNWGSYSASYADYSFNLGLKAHCFNHLVKQSRSGKFDYFVDGKMAFLRPILVDTPTNLRYAPNALPTDPASRLIILADTDKGDGTGKLRYLFTKGTKVVEKLNRLVDLFEGIDYDTSMSLERRHSSGMRSRETE
ncbi:uncharacterized protein N7473_012800 [Penicillium subrubescens]|nr:uncharacterized protein N7473_012800 [Penicillium subrubescens]KAJ5875453.1 hypothetical protein N7473_012800 [Penicillium subrubescens]